MAQREDISATDFVLHAVDELYGGMKIVHGRFGAGVIEAVDDNPAGAKITVLFKNAERKTLLLRFARFKIVDK
jgi:DNA helicase-2/ATP-dependent DNA helicase PcrA